MIPRLISSFVLAIVIVFSVNAQNDAESLLLNICEGSTEDSYIKIWPGTKCQQYASCYKGKFVARMICPSGLMMDADKQMCLRPTEVQCMDTAPNTMYQGCTRMAIQGACNNYTECDGTGGIVMKNCGEGTVFSNEKKVCIREINLTEDETDYCNTRPFV